MLNGNVHVFDDLRLRRDHVDELVGHFVRVEVVDAYPVELFDPAQLPQQLRQLSLSVKVNAVAAGILGDDDKLLYAVLGKHPRLIEAVLQAAAAVSAPQGGDDAVGAAVVAALRDLQIGIVRRGSQHTAGLRQDGIDVAETADSLICKQSLHRRDDVVIAARSQDAVHLGHFPQNFLLIALRKAAGDQDLTDDPLLLQRAHGQDIINGLALSRVDKAAGVDDNHIRALDAAQQLITGLLKQIHHLLRVDLVFCTAQGDHPDTLAHM